MCVSWLSQCLAFFGESFALDSGFNEVFTGASVSEPVAVGFDANALFFWFEAHSACEAFV